MPIAQPTGNAADQRPRTKLAAIGQSVTTGVVSAGGSAAAGGVVSAGRSPLADGLPSTDGDASVEGLGSMEGLASVGDLTPGGRSAPGGEAAAPVSPAPARIARPGDALAALIAGNRRFVGGRPQHGHEVSAAAAASGGQLPHAVVLGCIDSRVPLEAIFDQTFGSICVVRSGGHVVDRAVLGSVGFAVSALKVPLIMVLGHVRCGAVDATVQALRAAERPAGDVGYLVDEIAPAVQAVGLDDPEVTAKAMRAHVARTVRRLRDVTGVPDAIAAGKVAIAGAVYDLDTGWVDLLT
jgi:carbonic anhydrase